MGRRVPLAVREVAGRRFRHVDTFDDPGNLLVASGRLNGEDQWFGLHGMAELPRAAAATTT